MPVNVEKVEISADDTDASQMQMFDFSQLIK